MIKRISIGFLSIAILLFVAGMISLFELNRLGNDAKRLINESRSSMEAAKNMFDALEVNNAAVSHIVMTGYDESSSLQCKQSMANLKSIIDSASLRTPKNTLLDSLAVSADNLRTLSSNFVAKMMIAKKESNILGLSVMIPEIGQDTEGETDLFWYDNRYYPLITEISDMINRYMVQSTNGLTPQTEQLSRNAYRAVKPVFISLLVMIAIILMLFYFVIIYCVRPIININRSLADWLKFGKAYNVKAECRDELLAIRDNIKSLIERAEKNAK
ncbi:MAG: hypothetical protein J1E33_01710 [Alistipes sp.]|nr:hypothetical protein [Alistipes sp.]